MIFMLSIEEEDIENEHEEVENNNHQTMILKQMKRTIIKTKFVYLKVHLTENKQDITS